MWSSLFFPGSSTERFWNKIRETFCGPGEQRCLSLVSVLLPLTETYVEGPPRVSHEIPVILPAWRSLCGDPAPRDTECVGLKLGEGFCRKGGGRGELRTAERAVGERGCVGLSLDPYPCARGCRPLGVCSKPRKGRTIPTFTFGSNRFYCLTLCEHCYIEKV